MRGRVNQWPLRTLDVADHGACDQSSELDGAVFSHWPINSARDCVPERAAVAVAGTLAERFAQAVGL